MIVLLAHVLDVLCKAEEKKTTPFRLFVRLVVTLCQQRNCRIFMKFGMVI